ncbi:MAG: L-threonylcarbamoyladenylate synthase [Spirochaetes bacterium]|nr:L-threonylcarbamoyladenylate synthase [Spirochaetota bacterium]
MIDYVNIQNIDDRKIQKAILLLNEGSILAIPTDSNWSLVCSVKSKDGIAKLRKLKGNISSYTFTIFCKSISQISEMVDLDKHHFKFINKYTPGPFVFILPALKHIEKKINIKRATIGVRIPDNNIPLAILKHLDHPLFGITATKNMTDIDCFGDYDADENLFEFGWELEEIPEVDLIIDVESGEPQPKVHSTVINLIHDEPVIIRAGIGELE